MTFSQLKILNCKNPGSHFTIDTVISTLKEVKGGFHPYRVYRDIAGVDLIIFNAHFIRCMRQALTDGCMSGMGVEESTFWYEFVAYQNDIQDSVRDDFVGNPDNELANDRLLQRELALEELSRWISDELAGIPHPETKDCYITNIEEI